MSNTDQIVTYEKRSDYAYIYLAGRIPPGGSARIVQATADIILDFDKEGHLIGIELLCGSLLPEALLKRAIEPGSKK